MYAMGHLKSGRLFVVHVCMHSSITFNSRRKAADLLNKTAAKISMLFFGIYTPISYYHLFFENFFCLKSTVCIAATLHAGFKKLGDNSYEKKQKCPQWALDLNGSKIYHNGSKVIFDTSSFLV